GGRTSGPRCHPAPTPQARSPHTPAQRPPGQSPPDPTGYQPENAAAPRTPHSSRRSARPSAPTTYAPPPSSTHARSTQQPSAAPSAQDPTRHQRSTPPTDRPPPARPRPSPHQSRCPSHWQQPCQPSSPSGYITLPATCQSATHMEERLSSEQRSCSPRCCRWGVGGSLLGWGGVGRSSRRRSVSYAGVGYPRSLVPSLASACLEAGVAW